MIAPALAPATFSQVVIGFVGCSAKPQSAPASASPLTPPPRKTPSASLIHSTAGSSQSAAGDEHQSAADCRRGARHGPPEFPLLLLRLLAGRDGHCNERHSRGSFSPSAERTAIR